MSTEPFIVYGAPAFEQDEIDEVVATIKSGWWGTGPRVAAFERSFAEYKSAPHAAAVNSCTAALHLSLLVSDIGPGDEVITTPITFVATVNAIIHAGATPVLADVDPVTLNIDPKAVEAKITERTRAILPVHFAGRPCEMDELVALAQAHDLRIIEDCAHAVEATYHDQATGTFGDFGCFSFYVTKNLATGEGGMVLPRRAEDLARIKRLSLHGVDLDAWGRFGDGGYRHYDVAEPGFKYNMMDLQAALAIHQLARIDENHARRETLWRRYDERLAGLPVTLPAPPDPNTRHAYHLYSLMIDRDRAGISRDAFLSAVKEQGVGVGVHYLSMADRKYYQDRYGWRTEDCPNGHKIGSETASIPLSPRLTDDDAERVIAAVHRALGS